ncbi:hypothetical protein J1614_009496 [Plenodomus biglobosus]|nr:hypothetical protein J1614_009496 [Plenodomus biglobosus]
MSPDHRGRDQSFEIGPEIKLEISILSRSLNQTKEDLLYKDEELLNKDLICYCSCIGDKLIKTAGGLTMISKSVFVVCIEIMPIPAVKIVDGTLCWMLGYVPWYLLENCLVFKTSPMRA